MHECKHVLCTYVHDIIHTHTHTTHTLLYMHTHIQVFNSQMFHHTVVILYQSTTKELKVTNEFMM